MNDVVRIASAKDAASMLRVSTRRLKDMEEASPWWHADMRTDDGYDVVRIALEILDWIQIRRSVHG